MNAGTFQADETLVTGRWSAAYAGLHREGLAQFPPACLYYVLELVRHITREQGPPGPAALVAAFRATTHRDFGPLRDDVLNDWGLTRPAELGRAIALLGHAGCLTLGEGDAPAFYAADTRAFTDTLTDTENLTREAETSATDRAGDVP